MEILHKINLILILIIGARILFSEKDKSIFTISYLSLFSILCSLQYLLFNAPDVSITEVSIGACLTTIFLIRSIAYTFNYPYQKSEICYLSHLEFKKNYIIYFGIFFILFLIFFSKTSEFFIKTGIQNTSTYNSTIDYYINQTKHFFQFPNIITAILASFRGYDTLIEVLVILTSAIGISSIFPRDEKKIKNLSENNIQQNKSIIRNTLSFIIPFIIIFAFYIQAHGEESPGGGFQSGSILTCAIIAYCFAVNESIIEFYLKNKFLLRLGALGSVLYFIVGFIPMLKNKNFLNHSYLLCNINSQESCFSLSQKTGIFLIELGVGITVFSVMTLIFFTLNQKIKKEA
jgi:multicomponent Na+:H+ antiporter subunit B